MFVPHNDSLVWLWHFCLLEPDCLVGVQRSVSSLAYNVVFGARGAKSRWPTMQMTTRCYHPGVTSHRKSQNIRYSNPYVILDHLGNYLKTYVLGISGF